MRILGAVGEQPDVLGDPCAAGLLEEKLLEGLLVNAHGASPRALLHPGPTLTFTAVALRRGFVELGRFSVQHRQRYGEMPSETLRRVRGALPVNGYHRDGTCFTGPIRS